MSAVLLATSSMLLASPPAESAVTAAELWHWGPVANAFPQSTDIWSAPASARIFDTNDDGAVNDQDDPSLVFISGNAMGTICQSTAIPPMSCRNGILRILNGRTGEEQFSLDKSEDGSVGFAGVSVAIGDILGNGTMQIVAVTGEGYIALIGSSTSPPTPESMSVLRRSDIPLPNVSNSSFGYGGALALGNMNADQFLEIAFGRTVYTTKNNAISLLFVGTQGIGGPSVANPISSFAELNGVAGQELVAGHTVYNASGSIYWDRSSSLQDGYVAVADMVGNSSLEVVLVSGGSATVLDGATGLTLLGPKTLPGSGSGGPPVLADFDGDGRLEIGVAKANRYSVLNPNLSTDTLDLLWQMPTHDLGSAFTGSSALDFDDDGQAEVIHADECFLWVFDGATGKVKLGLSHTSTTSNEMPITADLDGDGKAELVMISNGADPETWGCVDDSLDPVTVNGITWVPSGVGNNAYRGVTVLNAVGGEWRDALARWNQHTFRTNTRGFRLGGIEVMVFQDGFESTE